MTNLEPYHDPPGDDFPKSVDPMKGLKDQPKRRMGSPDKLLSLVRSCEQSEQRHRFLSVCAEVDDMYDRKPPDDDYALAADGLAWTHNVDWGGMEFGVDMAIAPEFNLIYQPETYVKLESTYSGYDLSNQKRVVEAEDKRMLESWEEWIPTLGDMLFNRKKYGLGIFYFRHPRSWQFESLHPGNLLTTCSSMNPNRWSWCAIKTTIEISDLLRKLDTDGNNNDSDGFGDDGFNRQSIRRALQRHALQNKTGKGFDWHTYFNDAESWRNEYISNDLYYQQTHDLKIPGYIVYVKEFSGEITEYVLTDYDNTGFIFRSPDKQRLQQMSDAFCLFPEHAWQNSVLESRGYGIKNMAFFDADNNMNNRYLDSAYLSSSLFITGGEPNELYDMQGEVMIGPLTFLPSSFEIQASQMPDAGKNLAPIMEHLSRVRQNAGQASGGEGMGHAPDRETKYAAGMRVRQSQRLQNYQINFLYKLDERFHRIRFGRYMNDQMLESDRGYKEAEIVLTRMQAKGASEEFIKSLDLKATMVCTIFGDGDPARQYADLMDLMPTVGAMTQSGKNEFFRDLAYSKLGRDRSLAYFGNQEQDPTLLQNRAQAQLENGHFESSDARLDATDQDNHLVHATEHLEFAEAKAQAYEQGAVQPQILFETISRAMAHIGFNEDSQPVGGHIVPLLQDETTQEQAQDISRRMAVLVNLRRQIEQQLQAQAESQQQQQLENLKQPLEEQAKAQKVQQETQVAAQKAEIEMTLLREKVEHEREMMELQREKIQAEIEAIRQKVETSKQTEKAA